MAFRSASLYWCRWMRHRSRATCGLCKNSSGGHMRKLILATASVAALAGAGPASAQGPRGLKFRHLVAPATPKGKASGKFKELGEKKTKRKVKIDGLPHTPLFQGKE